MSASFNSVYFPPISSADEDGLLMFGGELAPEWLLEAYSHGIFPWPIVDQHLELLAWFSPDPRAVLELDDLYVSKRLARRIRSGQSQVTINTAFPQVIAGCAAPRSYESGTWVTDDLIAAYCQMHDLGHAHSVEVWQDDQLVGGLYGIAIGGMFAGESMFHRQRDASKVALYFLVRHLKQRGFSLLDIQQTTSHSQRMGSTELPRAVFLQRVAQAIADPVTFGDKLEVTC
ncbi:MAG TPA: leucyl/phenylalanyl-tRNA--protein transferase [Planctomycetaceae bacterium]|nr:leucyl/phenylalanyl-tRNA--protein transferase [Planctomycetaceae bacterium]